MRHYPTLLNAIFIGDRVLDIGHALGCYPRALIGGQVPLTDKDFPFIRHLECILCVMGPKRALLMKTYETMGIERVVIEHSDCTPDPASIADELRASGLTVDVVDFTQGMGRAFEDAGRIFGRPDEAARAARRHERDMEAMQRPVAPLGRRVVTLLGLTNPQRNEHYLLLETPGGHLDTRILTPLGCENAGALLMDMAEEVVMEGIQRVSSPDRLDRLDEAAPDAIVLTGDPLVGLMALQEAVARKPSLARSVPALAAHAVYALPHCCSALPASLPRIWTEWRNALSPQAAPCTQRQQ